MKKRKTFCHGITVFMIAAVLLCASAFSAAAAGEDIEGSPRTMLAYVKFEERLDGGIVQFLVDEVLWIDDTEMPNDYELYNEDEDWVPYVATEDTACSMWFFSEESGFMESREMWIGNPFLDKFIPNIKPHSRWQGCNLFL